MIDGHLHDQQIPQRILPKKPSISSIETQCQNEDLFVDPIPGEFHTGWEQSLWDVSLDGLDQLAHDHGFNPNIDAQLSSDPLLSGVENNMIVNETMRESQDDNGTVLFEMMVDNTHTTPPQDAFVLANSQDSTIDEYIEDISAQNSIGFNESSESGFDDSFCGWEPASILDTNSFEQESPKQDLLQAALTETIFDQRLQTVNSNPSRTEYTAFSVVKKKVGRPRKTTMQTVASVPVRGSKKLIENMKKRRLRDLNNIASQKCRAKKKEERLNEEKECQYQELRNKELKSKEKFLKERLERLRKILIRNGYSLSDFTIPSKIDNSY